MKFCQTPKKNRLMINSVMLHLNKVRDPSDKVLEELKAADMALSPILIQPQEIWGDLISEVSQTHLKFLNSFLVEQILSEGPRGDLFTRLK